MCKNEVMSFCNIANPTEVAGKFSTLQVTNKLDPSTFTFELCLNNRFQEDKNF